MIDMEHDLFLSPKKTPAKTHIMITKKVSRKDMRERKKAVQIFQNFGAIFIILKNLNAFWPVIQVYIMV